MDGRKEKATFMGSALKHDQPDHSFNQEDEGETILLKSEILMQVTQQQMLMELTQVNISLDNQNRIMELVTCHADPYSAAADGQL